LKRGMKARKRETDGWKDSRERREKKDEELRKQNERNSSDRRKMKTFCAKKYYIDITIIMKTK
jgi:hypothetical protein